MRNSRQLKDSLKGVLVTSVTPFSQDLSIDEEGIRANVRFLVDNGVNGIAPCGSIGEWSSLSTEELQRVVEITVDEAGGKIPIIAGASSTSTFEAGKRARIVEQAGADGVLVTPPFYMKRTTQGLVQHYEHVASNTNLGVVLYNAPDFLGFEVSTGELERIVDKVDSIVAIKDATPDMLEFSNRVRVLGRKVSMLLGNEPYCYHGLALGAPGTFTSVANFAPHRMKELYNAILMDRLSHAREIYLKLTEYFAFRRKIGNPISVVKTAMILNGIKIQRYVRPPLSDLQEQEKRELELTLEKLGLRMQTVY